MCPQKQLGNADAVIDERTFAWFGNFRRLVVRYERSLTIYEGFFYIACFMIVLRKVLK
ncbi:MAG TPA: hypothetical protein VGY31_12035 [Terriglobia bacterium]|nr:hypothetical protein [Terriglobia bacterium]